MQPEQFVNATAQRYDFCLMFGFLGDNIGGFFHVDYFFGVGVGYRTLQTTDASGADLDLSGYTFDNTVDSRYDPKRWGIYVPVRFGLRFGFNLL